MKHSLHNTRVHPHPPGVWYNWKKRERARDRGSACGEREEERRWALFQFLYIYADMRLYVDDVTTHTQAIIEDMNVKLPFFKECVKTLCTTVHRECSSRENTMCDGWGCYWICPVHPSLEKGERGANKSSPFTCTPPPTLLLFFPSLVTRCCSVRVHADVFASTHC